MLRLLQLEGCKNAAALRKYAEVIGKPEEGPWLMKKAYCSGAVQVTGEGEADKPETHLQLLALGHGQNGRVT